jgi:hypothetical protein
MTMAIDRKRLQDAIDDAFKAEIGAQFHSLISHLVEAAIPQPAGEPVRNKTRDEAFANFEHLVALISDAYAKVS